MLPDFPLVVQDDMGELGLLILEKAYGRFDTGRLASLDKLQFTQVHSRHMLFSKLPYCPFHSLILNNACGLRITYWRRHIALCASYTNLMFSIVMASLAFEVEDVQHSLSFFHIRSSSASRT